MVAKKKVVEVKPPMEFEDVGSLPTVLAVLLYGRSGTGKTTIASTFPKPLLLLDVKEKGWDSISNVPGVKVAKLTTWDEFESIYWYLEAGKHGFKTVVVDQLTTLQDLAIAKAMKDEGKEPDDVISKRVWGQGAGLMKTWIMNYRDLIDDGVQVVFLAHDRVSAGSDEEADDQIDPSVGARVMPSVASFLNGAVKVIANTFIRETFKIENKRKVRSVEFAMRIGPHSMYVTKTRTPVGITSPDIIVNPTYDKMVQVLEGNYTDGSPSTVRKKK